MVNNPITETDNKMIKHGPVASGRRIHVICALPAEALPLIKNLRLIPAPVVVDDHPFGTYTGFFHDVPITLVVAGVGNASVARAIDNLHGPSPRAPHAWLNVGIAGHATRAIGTPLLADKISDGIGTSDSRYPAFAFKPACATAEVITVFEPETCYNSDAAYDMEAHGFWTAASTHTTCELIHCLKIVSDNRKTPTTTVTPTRTSTLIASQLQPIFETLSALEKLLRIPKVLTVADPEIVAILERWHFTQTQRHQLLKAVQRLRAAENGTEFNVVNYLGTKAVQSGSDAIRFLRGRLSEFKPPGV